MFKQITGIVSNLDWKEDTFTLITDSKTNKSIRCWELFCLENYGLKDGDEVAVCILGDTPDGYKIVNIIQEEFID